MDVETVMRETAAGWVKGKVPAASRLPGPLEPTYTILEHTGCTIERAKVNRGLPG
jgi:hypothetical protein